MKKIFTSFLLLTAAIVAMGAPIGKEQAYQIAKHFLENNVRNTMNGSTRTTVCNIQLQQAANTKAYYIFNVGKEQGFIITAADDRMAHVLGYADHGCFDEEQCPDALKQLLAQYEQEAKLLSKLPANKQVAATRAETKRPAIAPLLKSAWSQYSPYNLQTPVDKEKKCVTGCVATAASQIMYYYQYPQASVAVEGYKTSTIGDINKLPATTFDWNNMLPSYRAKSSDTQQAAVAKLNRYVGQAVKMDYTYNDSGADSYMVVKQFPKLFGYAKDMHRVFRDQYTFDEWNNLIYNELKAKRPVYYFAEDIIYNYGHAFVCDGYQEGELFHINWGWGGSFNGYYRLSVLSPREYGFDQLPSVYVREQGAIIGFAPSTGNETCQKIVDIKEMKAFENKARDGKGEQFTSQYADLRCVNNYGEAFRAALGVGFYQGDKLVEAVQLKNGEFKDDGKIQHFTDNFNIPGTIANGTYLVKPICKIEGESNWKPCGGGNRLAQTIEITDTKLKNINKKVRKLKVTNIQIKGSKEVGRPLFVTFTLQNEGSDLLEKFNLMSNYSPVANTTAYVAAGQKTDIVFELYPKSAGAFIYELETETPYAKIGKTDKITITECNLTKLPKVEVKVETCDANSFYAPVMKGKLVVTNSDVVPYNGGFVVELRCRKGDTNKVVMDNKICILDLVPANQTLEIPFELPNVVVGAQYAVYVYGYTVSKEEDWINGGKMIYKPKKTDDPTKSSFYLAKANTNNISTLQRNAEQQPIYNLQGVKVGKGRHDFNSLPTGIYIIGNKKVVR